MTSLVERLDQSLYAGYVSNWDDHLFRECILEHNISQATILDLGAGAGIVQQMNFRGYAARVCGVDLDPRVVDNPLLDEGKVANAGKIPYPESTFDLVFADNVLEHLPRPGDVFSEIERVLKPGGVFLFKTPNKWHYMPTIARSTPHRFHEFVNRRRGLNDVDTFPTLYRANTYSDVQRLAVASGLKLERLDFIEGRPEYCRMAWPMYLVGAAYERLVNGWELLSPFRVLLVGRLRKNHSCSETSGKRDEVV